MVEVVEQEPGTRHRPQILVGRGLPLYQAGIPGLERQRDKREKPRSVVLLLSKAQHVLDPLRVGFDVPVEERRVRGEPHFVSDAVHFEPAIGAHLVFERRLVYPLGEDFGASDLDGTIGEERIAHYAQAQSALGLARNKLVDMIRESGKIPTERDALYNVVRVYN